MPYKILHVVSSPATSGVTAIIRLLLLHLNPNEYIQQFVHYGFTEGIACEVSSKGIPVHRIAPLPGFIKRFQRIWVQYHLRHLISAIQPDIIHAHSFDADLLAVRALGHHHHIPVVVSCQSFSYVQWVKANIRQYARWGKDIQLMIPVCQALSRNLSNIPELAAIPTKVIFNCPDSRFFSDMSIDERNNSRNAWGIGNNDVVIACVANYHPVKGHDGLVRSFSKITAHYPNARLVLAGTSKSSEGTTVKNNVMELIRTYSIRDRTIIVDPCLNPRHVLSAADIYVQPSHTEALSVAIGEAMASGLPVIATDVGGNPEIVMDGKTGMLVPKADDAAMGKAIGFLIAHPDIRIKMGAEGKRFALQYLSPESCLSAYQDVYKRVLNQ